MSDNVAIDIEQGADGSVIVNLETRRKASSALAGKFDSNLAESLGSDALAVISNELLEGISADTRSRADWLRNYNQGLQLLGLMLEEPAGLADKTISRVRHPLLLWSIIKFQALTQGEMLPASGPVKVRNDGDLSDEIAVDLERAFNRYLTVTASEYYPDTDRALFYLGYGGTIFKKVYRCPIRRRPVSEFVALPDLIVSQDAIDLTSAMRVTHRVEMSHQAVRRYQRMRFWRSVELPMPTQRIETTDEAEAKHVTGVAASRERSVDWSHTLYECYTTLDLSEWALSEKGQDEGIELPYRVTIDADSREVLEIRRNWLRDDPTWQPRKRFVKWGLIPGIGFLALGYLHLLGNHTKALTALERIIIDSGMFANFPSGVRAKGTRMENNVIQPGPGEFPEIDTGGLDIQKAIMALPFKGPDGTMLSLLQGLEAQGEKTAGQVEIKTGEGIADVPVGTIMAMIEQSTQVMTAVHRRLHQAQGEELQLLRELLIEEPSLLQIPGATPKWSAEQLASASLIPASNPNVPAHIHRIMQAVVLEQLSTAHPELYNIREVQRRILSIAKITDPESVLLPPASGAPAPDPTTVLGMLQAQIAEKQLALRKATDDQNAAIKAADLQVRAKETEAKIRQDDTALAQERQGHLEDLADRAADRSSREQQSQFATHTDADMRAQELQAQMDAERIQRTLSAAEANKDRTIDIVKTTADHASAQARHEGELAVKNRGLDVRQAPKGVPNGQG